MNIQQPALVFSAWNKDIDTEQNRKNVSWVKLQLKQYGVSYAIAQGCYKGQTEPALVVIDAEPARGIVQRLSRLLKQESILAIDANRAARLETCDGTLIAGLGTLRNVPEQVARACDAWTRVGEQFYTTESL